MSDRSGENSCENENLCVVCFKNVEIYSIGVCDHAVCFECSTRMRVLCRQNECPICRQDLPKVIFTEYVEPYNKLIMKAQRLQWQDRKYGLYFCSPEIQQEYYQLLEFRCPVCDDSDRNYFRTFQQLKDHMRRIHELFYCDLCVDNLKIFSFERKCYTRQELAHHRRKGDPDNTSHRGHPLCEFCETRFMDMDELFRHLRRNHMYCHFCDADGKHQYYKNIEDLRRHFQDVHYLCEEGECKNMPMAAVFRGEIDLKAHLATEHSKSLSKSANKQARTLELEFRLAPRARQDNGRNRGFGMRSERSEDDFYSHEMDPGGPGGGDYRDSRLFVNPLTPQDFPALGTSGNITVQSRPTTTVSFTAKRNTFNSEDFPSLDGSKARPTSAIAGPSSTSSARSSRAHDITITKTLRGQSTFDCNPQSFPALTPSTSNGTSTVHVQLNNTNARAPNFSIHVNQKPSGSSTHITSQFSKQQPTQKAAEAFPALSKVSSALQQPQWVQQKSKKQETKQHKVAPAPQLPPSDLSQFPSLSKNMKDKKSKKSSTITMSVNSVTNNNAGASVSRENSVESSSSSSSKQKNKSNNKNNDQPSTSKSKPKSKETSPTLESKVEDLKLNDDSKNKNKKKKSKNSNNVNVNNNVNKYESALQNDEEESQTRTSVSINNNNDTSTKNNNNKNGIVKKRSELRIGTLSVTEPSVNNNDFPVLVERKAPPGFTPKPPPGFNLSAQNFPGLSGSADLTFINSSGQSYSIVPKSGYHAPADFSVRNEVLCQHFMSILKDPQAIQEFKNYSYLFRTGSMRANKYYEHCRFVLGTKFHEIFPELIVLLPDIDKQQELYNVHTGSSKELLVICENCRQVLLKTELAEHHKSHTLDNHFPNLKKNTQTNNVWKTN